MPKATLNDFRSYFPEFATVSDSTVTFWMSEAEADIDFNRWGSFGKRGHLYLSAHNLKMSLTRSNSGSSQYPISSKSVGGLSVSFSVPVVDAADSEYASTAYGSKFLEYRAIVGIGAVAVL